MTDEILRALKVLQDSIAAFEARTTSEFAAVRGEIGDLRRDVTEHRAETIREFTAVRGEIGDLRRDVTEHRAETTREFTAVRGEIGDLRRDVTEHRAETTREFTAVRGEIGDLRRDVTDHRAETTSGFAAVHGRIDGLRADMNAGFARVDRYIELQQGQFLDLLAEVKALARRVAAVEEQLGAVQQGVSALRDWAGRELNEVQSGIRQLREMPVTPAVQAELDALNERVAGLADELKRR